MKKPIKREITEEMIDDCWIAWCDINKNGILSDVAKKIVGNGETLKKVIKRLKSEFNPKSSWDKPFYDRIR